MIEIRRYVSGLLSSNMYLIGEGNHGIVIDPCADTMPAQGLEIDYILLTHEHYDHISGVNIWKHLTGAPVLCSKPCADNLQSPRKNLAAHFQQFCELQTWIELESIPEADPEYTCTAEETFENEMCLHWQGHTLKLFEIPGHSQGSTGILLNEKDFFSGDSLLENQETELRFPGGSRKLWREIGSKRIAAIPEGTRIWPGHFDSFLLRRSD